MAGRDLYGMAVPASKEAAGVKETTPVPAS